MARRVDPHEPLSTGELGRARTAKTGASQMYYAMIVLLMGVLPIASIVVERLIDNADLAVLLGKWFVFWACGVRLLLAGVRQIANPTFTADTIFGIADKDAGKIVSELGFANVAIGVLSVASIARPDWVLPAAIVAGLYYGLAGVKHVFNASRNRIENWATASDLGIFVVLAIYVALTLR